MDLAGALMEHFFEGKDPLRLWPVNSEEKIFSLVSLEKNHHKTTFSVKISV